jgi:putative transposase
VGQDEAMKKMESLYHGHRFPAPFVSHAVHWYFRFQLNLRDIERLLFERGVIVSHKSIRRWRDKFGTAQAHWIKATRRKPGSSCHLDEVLVGRRGKPYALWCEVDQHSIELDILVQNWHDRAAPPNASSNGRRQPAPKKPPCMANSVPRNFSVANFHLHCPKSVHRLLNDGIRPRLCTFSSAS